MKNELVENNINLVYHVIKQMGLTAKLEEYYDLGLIGLVRAAQRYDVDKRNSVFDFCCSMHT